MRTTEGNVLIADFIDLSKQDKSNGGKFYLYESPETGEYIEPEELKYDSSWDWLMPVVGKIINDLGVHEESEFMVCVKYNLSAVQLDAVWLNVIKFIQWHNEQK